MRNETPAERRARLMLDLRRTEKELRSYASRQLGEVAPDDLAAWGKLYEQRRALERRLYSCR